MIEGTGESSQTVTRNTPVGRCDADNTAKRSRLTDGPARVRSQRDDSGSLGDDSAGAAAGSPRNTVQRHRITPRTERGILVGRAHREFIAVGFSEDHPARLFEPDDGGRVV